MTDLPERRRQGEEADLNQRLDLLISRADSIDGGLVADKAAREAENVKRDRRIRYSQFAIAVALGIAAFAIISAHVQHDNDVRDINTRRTSFCRSLDDVGSAIKAGNVGAIQTLFDPQFQGPNADPARLQAFVDLFTANGAKGVDKQISAVKTQNGFADDCRILNPTSSTDTGWIAALFLLGLLILVFVGLFGAFVLAARRSARTIQRK